MGGGCRSSRGRSLAAAQGGSRNSRCKAFRGRGRGTMGARGRGRNERKPEDEEEVERTLLAGELIHV